MYEIIKIVGFAMFFSYVITVTGKEDKAGKATGSWMCSCYPPSELKHNGEDEIIDPKVSPDMLKVLCPESQMFGCIDQKLEHRSKIPQMTPDERNKAAATPEARNDVAAKQESKPNTCGTQLIRTNPSHTPEPHEADYGEYPWVAYIYSDFRFLGTGALVSNRHVVTIASKIAIQFDQKITTTELPQEHTAGMRVRLGLWHQKVNSEPELDMEWAVESVMFHPQRVDSFINNLAVIRLKVPLDLSQFPHIQEICLPEANEDFTGKSCWISGWGRDTFRGNQKLDYMHESKMDVSEKGKCIKNFEHKVGPIPITNNLNDPTILCAEVIDKEFKCAGDFGAPLVCQNSGGQFQLAGVMTFGTSCSHGGTAGNLFASVPQGLTWIQTQLV